ncbi:SHOCT domain-containing protein [Nonomuraea recticatena]
MGPRAAPPAAPQAGPSAAPSADPLADLERLARLHDSGALSDAEFAAMKARLIGG